MKFIVVENDENTQENICSVIKEVTSEKVDINIECYKKVTRELLDSINNISEPKVYILDISLDGKTSGITIAKKIRKCDWESHIIFLTSHDKMFDQVHRSVYAVFDFIEKFHNMEKRLKNDLKLIMSQKYDNKVYHYSSRTVDFQIFYKEILYIERDTNERKVIVVTASNKLKISTSLLQMLSELDSRFKQCHRACVVNTERVLKYDWVKGEFILDTGEKIRLLSKKYRNEVINNGV